MVLVSDKKIWIRLLVLLGIRFHTKKTPTPAPQPSGNLRNKESNLAPVNACVKKNCRRYPPCRYSTQNSLLSTWDRRSCPCAPWREKMKNEDFMFKANEHKGRFSLESNCQQYTTNWSVYKYAKRLLPANCYQFESCWSLRPGWKNTYIGHVSIKKTAKSGRFHYVGLCRPGGLQPFCRGPLQLLKNSSRAGHLR